MTPNFPTCQYAVLYADPPWNYRDKASAGKRGASYKYPCMSVAEIAALPVQAISAPHSAMFMWVTPPMLDAGMDVLKAWGYEYKTIAFTWVKTTKRGKLFWGMGNWTRANAEHCLLGVRGKPKRVSAAVHSVIMAPVREHSRKPDEARERIVNLMGDVPRIELFARQRVDGWDAWGNELQEAPET